MIQISETTSESNKTALIIAKLLPKERGKILYNFRVFAVVLIKGEKTQEVVTDLIQGADSINRVHAISQLILENK